MHCKVRYKSPFWSLQNKHDEVAANKTSYLGVADIRSCLPGLSLYSATRFARGGGSKLKQQRGLMSHKAFRDH